MSNIDWNSSFFYKAPIIDKNSYTSGSIGITIREWFAGLAMQGILSNEEAWDMTAEETARIAVNHAEALINELNKWKPRV